MIAEQLRGKHGGTSVAPARGYPEHVNKRDGHAGLHHQSARFLIDKMDQTSVTAVEQLAIEASDFASLYSRLVSTSVSAWLKRQGRQPRILSNFISIKSVLLKS